MPEPADDAPPAPPPPPDPPPAASQPFVNDQVTNNAAAVAAEVAKAVKAAKAEWTKTVHAELGVDLPAAKAALEAQRQAEAAQLSEAERREQAAAAREQAAEAREASALARERNAFVSTALVAAGAPADKAEGLIRMVDLAVDNLNADEIRAAAIEAVAAVKAEYPALFGTPGHAPSGVPGGTPPTTAVKDDLADARARGDQWRKEHSTTADPLAGFRRVGAPPGA